MKNANKKLVLLVSIILVVITACVCLVGCVPNRPDKFVGTWVSSENKAIILADSAVSAIDGNKMLKKIDDNNQTIFEKKSDKIVCYTCIGGNWSASYMTIQEAEKDKDYIKINTDLEDNKTLEKIKQALDKAQENYKENFEKDKDGWWKPKGDLAKLFAIEMKVEGKQLKAKATALGGIVEAGEGLITLELNYKIRIPKGASDALKAAEK